MTFPQTAPHDSVASGVGISLLCQFLLIVCGVFTIFIPRFGFILVAGWGLAQWIFLLPLYFSCRSRGRPLKAKGILIAGCIGFLLNAGCDALIRWN